MTPSPSSPPTKDLIKRALSSTGKARQDCVVTLHTRADKETFKVSKELLFSNSYKARELGADILSQLGYNHKPKYPYKAATLKLFKKLLKQEKSLRVINAICIGSKHLCDEEDHEMVPFLLEKSFHKSALVRFGAVVGLMGHDLPDVNSRMIALCQDPDDDIRDYATFGLGTMIENHDPQIIKTLQERLNDSDPDVRFEATEGLKKRGLPVEAKNPSTHNV